jgi:predicted DNA binding CopG/RHH family protein
MAQKTQSKAKPIPHFRSDEDMERFVATADLTEYDLSGFRPISFYLQKKDARVNMRMPEKLLRSVKSIAEAESVPYQRLIRDFIEKGVEQRLSQRKKAS